MPANQVVWWKPFLLLVMIVTVIVPWTAIADDLEVRISSMIPSERVFYTDEDIRLRIIMEFDQEIQFEHVMVDFEVVDLESGMIVDEGSAPFNQTVRRAGWVEFHPNVPGDPGIHWYRLDFSFRDADQEMSVRGASEENPARVAFGVNTLSKLETRPSTTESRVDSSRKVMAFYYPWYGNPSTSFGWIHWPEGGHNPYASDTDGLPDLGATNHPVLGPYDSHDPRVIEQHMTWARDAGIDVLISTWWGQGEFSDRAFPALLDAAAASDVEMSVYYEEVPGSRPDGVLNDFRYLLDKYGDHSATFKHEGDMVIFVYVRALNQLSFEQWEYVLDTIKAEYDVKVIADSLDGRWADIFDGLHMYNPVGQVVSGADMSQVFESLVWASKSRGKVTSVTVIPGYDDSNIGRANVIIADRDGGKLYDELWEMAIESRPDWILITSFNEWHEGSEIEPSIEDGTTYLEATTGWSARFKEASERTIWVEKATMPVVAFPGESYILSADLFSEADHEQLVVEWDVPIGWSVEETEMFSDGDTKVVVNGKLVVAQQATAGIHALGMNLSLGGFDINVSGEVVVPEDHNALFEGNGVWVEFDEPESAYGLTQIEQPDGVTQLTEVGGVVARQMVAGVSDHKYMYFDVADRWLFDVERVGVEIGIEYLDQGRSTFRVQYDSSNPQGGPLSGAYTDAPLIRLGDTGEWKVARVTIPDARFANRQNGGSDFRLAAGTGDLIVRQVYVKVIE